MATLPKMIQPNDVLPHCNITMSRTRVTIDGLVRIVWSAAAIDTRNGRCLGYVHGQPDMVTAIEQLEQKVLASK